MYSALSLGATLAVVASLSGVPSPRLQTTPPKACAGAEHRQFDFWIGDSTVHRQTDGKVAGTNRIQRIAGGCGLQETWTGASGHTGRSLNAYSPQDCKWHQVWLDSDGLWMHLTGGVRAGSMVLEGKTLGRDKKVEALQRITWTPPRGRHGASALGAIQRRRKVVGRRLRRHLLEEAGKTEHT